MTRQRIALFASGSGSNVQAIIDACRKGELQADPVLLVCDKPKAKVVERAIEASIPVFTFLPKMYENKEAFEQEILQKLQQQNVAYIILAGYMRLVGPTLIHAYEGKMINIHPSLLPAFPGLDAIGQAIKAKAEVTGVTVHYVDEGMDTGPIIAQQPVKILPEETKESLQKKIQQVEHILYPKTLQKILQTEKESTLS
ncbi:phosphoribosylglycinamide formyltransferase [Bacillus sp. FJAT-45066]|uniref:phosphoribosylglycinamide formyltransferase n=1 Tax=Bacillus sp. FJAT-45066 TaxID=2011010 RepID=UPI000BB85452|nr:phosphoribosylglycinamide formyltransferase [Bacillus sp. FJAT-45066]